MDLVKEGCSSMRKKHRFDHHGRGPEIFREGSIWETNCLDFTIAFLTPEKNKFSRGGKIIGLGNESSIAFNGIMPSADKN